MHKSGYFKNGSKLNATMLQSTWNYYPFGSAMPTRNWSDPNSKYKYGFNGKEKDDGDEGMGGGGSTYDYGFRIYNPNLGKFLSLDPLTKDYPWYSPFHFAGNTPIAAVDLDGLEIYFAANGNYIGKWGTSTEIRVISNDRIQDLKTSIKNANEKPQDPNCTDVMVHYWPSNCFSHTPSTEEKSKITKGHVISTSTHESYSTHGDCYASACATLANNNYEPGSYWGDKQYEFQMYTETTSPNVNITKTRLAGFEKINSDLEAGKPILVGVNYKSGSSNAGTDGTTDHFIVLTGRGFDDAGKLYYTGFENVDGGDTNLGTSTSLNRFYPQEDGTLKGGTCYRDGMTITQVRPVTKKETTTTN